MSPSVLCTLHPKHIYAHLADSVAGLKQSLPTFTCSFLLMISKGNRRIANKGTNEEKNVHPE